MILRIQDTIGDTVCFFLFPFHSDGKKLMNEVGFAFDCLKSSWTCNQET